MEAADIIRRLLEERLEELPYLARVFRWYIAR